MTTLSRGIRRPEAQQTSGAANAVLPLPKPSASQSTFNYWDIFTNPDPNIALWKRIVGGATLPIVGPLSLFAGCSGTTQQIPPKVSKPEPDESTKHSSPSFHYSSGQGFAEIDAKTADFPRPYQMTVRCSGYAYKTELEYAVPVTRQITENVVHHDRWSSASWSVPVSKTITTYEYRRETIAKKDSTQCAPFNKEYLSLYDSQKNTVPYTVLLSQEDSQATIEFSIRRNESYRAVLKGPWDPQNRAVMFSRRQINLYPREGVRNVLKPLIPENLSSLCKSESRLGRSLSRRISLASMELLDNRTNGREYGRWHGWSIGQVKFNLWKDWPQKDGDGWSTTMAVSTPTSVLITTAIPREKKIVISLDWHLAVDYGREQTKIGYGGGAERKTYVLPLNDFSDFYLKARRETAVKEGRVTLDGKPILLFAEKEMKYVRLVGETGMDNQLGEYIQIWVVPVPEPNAPLQRGTPLLSFFAHGGEVCGGDKESIRILE